MYMDSIWGSPPVHSTPPVVRDDTFAVIGGWQFPEDGEVFQSGELVLTAFATGEPFVEVRRTAAGEYVVVERCT